MQHRKSFLPTMLATVCFGTYAVAQVPSQATPQIVQSIDESATVTLAGNVHPAAAAATNSTPADLGTAMRHMVLYLKGNAAQEAALQQLIAQQNDPKSPSYHQFLTPQSFGAQFGAAPADIAKLTAWLQSHGFTVEQIPAGNRALVFSGTAAQVTSAFKTEIRQYNVSGNNHYANAGDPQIPSALAGAIGGIVKLNDFQHTANISKTTAVTAAQLANPQFNYGSSHYLAPADYSTIYDLNPLYTANINGTGQTIAILARSNIYLSDVQSFRSQFGLPANNPQIVITGTDPGVLQGDSVETTLDTEWSGAVAPKATVKVIVSASTNTADGIDLSALYAVNNNVAPVISLSYGSCESEMGAGGLAYYNSLWQQAAAQGISVMVSSGDNGAAGCDYGTVATNGRAVNGLCSSPYATCVGGTEFVEGTNPGQYWLPGNNPNMGSAIGYIPETVWNESGANGGSGLWAGGGGASIAYPKPSWQSGPGVPADGKRDVPDVSLSASSHDGYLIWLYGGLNAVGGTSAAAPSFAGMMALVGQKTNARPGLANTVLYPLATSQAAGGAAVFHDTKTGNNSVPGVTGFSAGVGYDQASGLGSVDAANMVNQWTGSSSTTASLSLSAAAASLNVIAGQTVQTTLTAAATALNAAVTLSVTGAPAGLTATLTPATIASPGSGTAVLKIVTTSSIVPGAYSLTVTGSGAAKTAAVVISVVIPTPTFALAAGATSIPLIQGKTGQITFSTTPQNGFNAAVTLTVIGLPSGVSAAFSSVTLPAAGGTSTLTLTAATSITAGSYPLTVTAKGGGVTQTSAVTLIITVPPGCTLGANPTGVALTAGTSASILLSCGAVRGSFTAPLTLSVSGSPSGMTAQLSANTLTPGSVTALNLASTLTTAAGRYSLSVTAAGSGFTQTLALPVSVTAASTFSLTAANSALTIRPGASAQVTLTSAHIGNYNAAVSFAIAGLPLGVSASLSKTSLAAPGDGAVVATFTVTSSAKPGTYAIAATGSGMSIVQTAPIALTIPATQDFSLAVNVSSLTMTQSGAGTVIVSTGNFAGGFNSTITITFSGLAPGMNWGNVGATTGNNLVNSSIRFTAASNTPPGTYPITITAGGAGIVHTATVQMTVTQASH